MEKEVKREKVIPAFSINIDELDILWGKIESLFDPQDKIYSSLDIIFPKEKLTFENIKELRSYQELKGKIFRFSLHVSNNNKRVSLWNSDFSLNDSRATVYASGDSEHWCAGAVDTVYSYLQSYKLWYHWLVVTPFGILLMVLFCVPILLIKTQNQSELIKSWFVFGWSAFLVPLALVFLFKNKILPAAILNFSNDENLLRRYSPEIIAVCAILSVILMVIGFLVSKNS